MLWGRFILRSSCVREVRVSDSFCCKELELIRHLVSNNGGSTFLPNLRLIEWHDNLEVGSFLELVDLVVPPCLTTLYYIPRGEPPADVTATLMRFSGAAQTLTFLQVNCWSNSAYVMPRISRLVPLFQHLRHLAIPHGLSLQDMSQVSLLPALEVFRCSMEGHLFAPSQWDGTIALPKLRTLDITGSLECVSTFFAHFRSPYLSSVSLRLDFHLDSGDTKALFRNLSASASAKQLIDMDFHVKGDPDDLPSVDFGDVLQPLLSHRRVRQFFIEHTCFATLSDDDVLSMAKAWGELTEFGLAPSYFDSFRNVVTPKALEHLAQFCTHLTWVGVPLYIFRNPSIPAQPSTPSHPLMNLIVEIFHIRSTVQPVKLAQFIDVLFPNIVVPSPMVPPKRAVSFSQIIWDETLVVLASLQRERLRPEVIRPHSGNTAHSLQ